MPGIKVRLVLINMAAMMLHMWPLSLKMGSRYMVRNHSVHVLVKGSPAQEPVIKDGKKRKSCLLDGEKRSYHLKTKSVIPVRWKSQQKSHHHPIWPWPCFTRHGGKQKIPGEWICQREAIKETESFTGRWNIAKGISDTKLDPCPAQGIIKDTEMILVGLNSQHPKEPGLVLLNMHCRRKKRFLVDEIVRGRTTMLKIIEALWRCSGEENDDYLWMK